MNIFITYSKQTTKFAIALLLAVLLLLRAIFPAMNDEEALEVRYLVKHFQYHQTSEHSSVWDFLLQHYSPFSSHTISAKHSAEHHGLPLHCYHLHGASFVALPASAEAIPLRFPSVTCRICFGVVQPLSVLYTSIFQPPKSIGQALHS